MLARDTPITVAGEAVDPYLHLDNRGLVVFDGRRCVMFTAPDLPWVAETLDILRDEKRATRRHGGHVLGGHLSDDGAHATIYAGPADDLATLRVDAESLGVLVERLRAR
jgi:hypothetical protein